MKDIKILFVGSHLSKARGTKGVAENIATRLNKKYKINLTSYLQNQFLRLFDIFFTTLFSKYDIVQIDIFSGKALIYAKIATFIATLRKKKIIMTLHGGRLCEYHQKNPDTLSKLFEKSNILLSPSKFLIKYFNENNFNINYLPNFIDQKKFPYKRDEIKKISILWVRAFNDIYQPELAIKIIYNLISIFPNITLTMIGPDKGFKDKTLLLIKKLGIEKKINILGSIGNEELYKYYQTHSVYLNTTEYESFGLAVLEAASCGIPIVSTNVGEIPYMWDKEEILMSISDDKIMANNVKNILKSNKLAQQLSTNARTKSERFDWSIIEKEWEKIINEL